jgi:hypothetical protein
MSDMRPAARALRAHDIHQGLHEVDRDSAVIAAHLEATELVGMAAAVASWIKGHDVIADAQALKHVAAEQLDVGSFAFDDVVELLEGLEFVRNVQREGRRVVSFYESVPADYERMYSVLGQSWQEQRPTEVEASLISVVDELSRGPAAVDELDIDPAARDLVMEVGREAEAIQIVSLGERLVAYSPFFAYENPKGVEAALQSLDIDRVAAAFKRVRSFQGIPISTSPQAEIFNGLVAAGLMAGPSLERPDHTRELFAIAPYGLPGDVLTIQRPLLEKALAIVAAVRMGQHFGGITNLSSPVAFLHALLQPERVVAWHSSTTRQYAALQRMGIVRFVTQSGRSGITLIDTPDNKAAVQIAIDLLEAGEATTTKELPGGFERALLVPGNYRSQIQGIRPAKRRKAIPEEELAAMVDAVMGRRAE